MARKGKKKGGRKSSAKPARAKPKSQRQRIKGYTRKDGVKVKGYLRKRPGAAALPGAKFQPRAGEAPPESGGYGGGGGGGNITPSTPDYDMEFPDDWADIDYDYDGLDEDADDSYAESET